MYDYTDTHSLGEKSGAVIIRDRATPRKEVAYISPTDGRDWFVVVEEVPACTQVQFLHEVEIKHTVFDELDGETATCKSREIRNSRYIMVATLSGKILIHNYDDDSISNRIINTGYQSGTLTAISEFIDWRLLLTSGGDNNYFQVFSLQERPCSDTMTLTCDSLDPRIPLTCKPNASV